MLIIISQSYAYKYLNTNLEPKQRYKFKHIGYLSFQTSKWVIKLFIKYQDSYYLLGMTGAIGSDWELSNLNLVLDLYINLYYNVDILHCSM